MHCRFRRAVCLFLIVLLCFSLSPSASALAALPELFCEAALVIHPDTNLVLYAKNPDRQLACSGAAVLFSQEETARTLRRELREILRPLMDRTPNPQLQPMSGAAQHLTLSWENVGSCEVYLESGEVELIPRFGTKQHWALSGEEKENLLAWIDSAAWEPGEGSVELIAGETYCPAQSLDGLLLTLAIWQTAPES